MIDAWPINPNEIVRTVRPRAEFVTEPEGILRELMHSKLKGNVLGICAQPFGKSMCMTAIDDIQNIESEHTHDKLVVLKKYDLQGTFIDTHELCLSEITKVKPFRRKYHDRFSLFFRSDFQRSYSDHIVKIRRMEQSISFHELQIILIKIINSGYRISVYRWHEAMPCVESCYVRDFVDGKFDTVIVSCGIRDTATKDIYLKDVECILFESFFYYKGFSSKVFRVEEK